MTFGIFLQYLTSLKVSYLSLDLRSTPTAPYLDAISVRCVALPNLTGKPTTKNLEFEIQEAPVIPQAGFAYLVGRVGT